MKHTSQIVLAMGVALAAGGTEVACADTTATQAPAAQQQPAQTKTTASPAAQTPPQTSTAATEKKAAAASPAAEKPAQPAPSAKQAPQYHVGDQVQVKSTAWRCADNTSAEPLQNQDGVVTGVRPQHFFESDWVYDLKLVNQQPAKRVLEQDLVPYQQVTNQQAINEEAIIDAKRGNHGIYREQPYGIAGGYYADSTRNHDQQAITLKERFTVKATQVDWYRFDLDGKPAYVDTRAVLPLDKVAQEDTVNQWGQITNPGRRDGVFVNAPYHVRADAQWTKTTADLTNQVAHISKIAHVSNGVHWYCAQFDNTPQNYWIDSRAFSSVAPKFAANAAVLATHATDRDANNNDIKRLRDSELRIVASRSLTARNSRSRFAYDVATTNGTIVKNILEQDVVTAATKPFNVGDMVALKNNATFTADWHNIMRYRGKIAKITAAHVQPAFGSTWTYQLAVDGQSISGVSASDLQRYVAPTPQVTVAPVAKNRVNNDAVVNWFQSRKGKLTYSMEGSRNGVDGTADCSGSVTEAVYRAGGKKYDYLYSTETLHSYLHNNGYKLICDNADAGWESRRGDIVIWGKRGFSSGSFGHVGVLTTNDDNPLFISTCYMTQGQRGTAVQEVRYNDYAAANNWPYYYVYRQG